MHDEAVPAVQICRLTTEGAEVSLPEGPSLCVDATGAPEAALRGAVRAAWESGRKVTVRPPDLVSGGTLSDALDGLERAADAALAWPGVGLVPPRVRGEVAGEVGAWAAACAGDPARVLERVRQAIWDESGGPGSAAEPALRRLDDLPRRLIFRTLRDAWLERSRDPFERVPKEVALGYAAARLGEAASWRRAFRQFTYESPRRMVLIPTWQCELRCTYCWIPKQDGRVMSLATVDRGIDLAFSTERDEIEIQFFGGEALLEPHKVRRAMERAVGLAAVRGKRVGFVLSSNGWSLNAEQLGWLSRFPVRLELSLDGDEDTQRRYRPAHTSRESEGDSYANSIAAHREAILASGIEQNVIMVVHPQNVDRLFHNFFHIAGLGFRRIQINNMLGVAWRPDQMKAWAQQLHAIGQELLRRQGGPDAVELVNLEHRPVAMRLNGEVTVDHDGTIYGGNSFLHETEHKDRFVIDHLDTCANIDRYWIDATENGFLLDWSYRPTITRNNQEVGKVLASLCGWLRKQGLGREPPRILAHPEVQEGRVRGA